MGDDRLPALMDAVDDRVGRSSGSDPDTVADRPVFIIGAPRSGTSLMYRALALHPRAAWINNYQRRAPGLHSLAALNRIAMMAPRTRQRVWFGSDGDNAYRYGSDRSVLDRWFPQPVEGEPLFRHRGIPEQSDSVSPTPQQLQFRRDVGRMARFSGGDVLISKRIGHNLRIPLLLSIFPEARFIDLTRDGRAVTASLLRVDWWEENPLWWYGGSPADAAADGLDPVLLGATHWVREVEAIAQGLTAVPAAQVLHLRYEDLVQNSDEVLRSAAGFAGLRLSRGWTQSLRGLKFPNKNDEWKPRLGVRAADVTAVQQDQLSRLGYLD